MFQYLASNLRRFRRERDLSQAHLASRAGVTQQYVSDLERGLRPSRIVHLERLARALDVDVVELLGLNLSAATGAGEVQAAR